MAQRAEILFGMCEFKGKETIFTDLRKSQWLRICSFQVAIGK